MSSEPIIRTDLGTIFFCVAIMRNEKVEIIEEKQQEKK